MLERFYIKSPYVIKFVLLNLKGFLNNRNRYEHKYNQYLEEYIKLWDADISEIESYQKQKLIELLLETKQYVSYYKNLFEINKITEKEIEEDPFLTLKKIPLLAKDTRKSKVQLLINNNPDRKLIETGFTSGTSGSPTEIFFDKESIERGFALWHRFHSVIGINQKMRSIRLTGRIIIDPKKSHKPFWIYNYFDNQLFMSTYHLKDEYLNEYVKKINEFKPEFIDGYPSAIYVLARFINTNKINLTCNVKAIATTAETLYDYQRTEIETAFKTKVYNQYASSEGSPFITECKEGSLHVNSDSGVFEFLDNNNNIAKPGEIARLVVTSFRNYKTPLIRYDIGDNVLLHNDLNFLCKCGCKMPVIDKIIGREDDILWTYEKGYVGRMDTAFKGLQGITKSQIIQENPNTIIINNVVEDSFDEKQQAKFLENLRQRLGYKIEYVFNTVKEIPLNSNGKFDAVKREFKIEDYAS